MENPGLLANALYGDTQTKTIVDLLNAAAHDPDLVYDSESDDDSDDVLTPVDTSDNETGSSLEPLEFETPDDEKVEKMRSRPNPIRGQSFKYVGTRLNPQLAIELALDGLDNVDQAIERAQMGHEGIRASDTNYADPKVIDELVTPEEKLERLTQEFGVWSDDSEKFIIQIPGALYRGVLVKGVLALTNRRLFFYAFMPVLEDNKVIRSGPLTVHTPGVLEKKKRYWFELKSDSCIWYPSSRKTYRPVGAARLSGLKEILPYDSAQPNFVRLELVDGRSRCLETDTAESASAWRRDLEATLFSFRTKSDKLRVSLPLQLVQTISIEPYLPVAEMIQLCFETDLLCDDGKMDFSQERKGLQSLEFGYLKTHDELGKKLKATIDLCKEELGATCSSILPIIEIESPEDVGEKERMQELKDDKRLPAQFCRTFALKDRPDDLFLASCKLVRHTPAPGSLAIGAVFFCFWRKNVLSSDTKLRIPLVDIDDVSPCKAFGFHVYGLSIQVHGAPDVRLDFVSKKWRDNTVDKLKEALLAVQLADMTVAGPMTSEPDPLTPLASVASTPLKAPTPTPTPPLTPVSRDSGLTRLIAPSRSSSNDRRSPIAASYRVPPSALSDATVSASPYQVSELRDSFSMDDGHKVIFGQDLEEDVRLPAGHYNPISPRIMNTAGSIKITAQHFTLMTIGSRGDVQPYIALGRQLVKDGNRVTIASHPEYREWVESFGLSYREIGGDPGALMKLTVEHKMFSPGFFKESLGHFRQWLDDLFAESWAACQGTDILIESPSTMAGIHCAEALGIPYFRAFTMPWTATSTYPQAFAASVDLGPAYNALSYTLFDSIIWKAMAGQVNRWRKNMLHLPPTNLHKMSQAKTPFIYNFSSAVVPKPNDWRDFIFISGYWFLDDDKPWIPPAGLMDFIKKARVDKKPLIYVGFGSIVVPDAAAMTRNIVKAVANSGVRAILSKGWSDRGSENKEVVPLSDDIFSVPSIPHDRLFPLIDAACHHGGAGTTGASLRAGLPTLIHPFFGDQYFWASRVQKLHAGLRIDSLSEKDFTSAFKLGTTDRVLKEKAAGIGEKIRLENGPQAALGFIYDHIRLAQERGCIRASRAAGTEVKSTKGTCVPCLALQGRSKTSTSLKSKVLQTASKESKASFDDDRLNRRSFTFPIAAGDS